MTTTVLKELTDWATLIYGAPKTTQMHVRGEGGDWKTEGTYPNTKRIEFEMQQTGSNLYSPEPIGQTAAKTTAVGLVYTAAAYAAYQAYSYFTPTALLTTAIIFAEPLRCIMKNIYLGHVKIDADTQETLKKTVKSTGYATAYIANSFLGIFNPQEAREQMNQLETLRVRDKEGFSLLQFLGLAPIGNTNDTESGLPKYGQVKKD